MLTTRQYIPEDSKLQRIHNITAKTALKYGSETWVSNKRDKQSLEAEHM
jgi:hypothetical protein